MSFGGIVGSDQIFVLGLFGIVFVSLYACVGSFEYIIEKEMLNDSTWSHSRPRLAFAWLIVVTIFWLPVLVGWAIFAALQAVFEGLPEMHRRIRDYRKEHAGTFNPFR
jgi:hypothetical protein